MRGTLVFVHGTGVRQDGLVKTWQAFQKGAKERGFDGVRFEVCDWGPVLAPTLDRIDASLPVTAAPELLMLEDADSAAAWALLIEDPLFELRLAAEAAGRPTPAAIPGQTRPDEAAISLILNLASLEELDEEGLLSAAGVSGNEIRHAASAIAQSEEFAQGAITAGSPLDEDFLEGTARAIVALVLAKHRADPPGLQPEIAYRRDLRVALVEFVILNLYPGATRAIGAWLRKKVLRFVANRTTDALVARRSQLMGLASAALADILYYQRRGGEIRAYVDRSLHGREGPLVVVAHSLGGVIMVDLLSSEDAPHVDLLVTIGSQAPLFYAIDALEYLRPGARLEPFTPWLNIFNEDDLLSFCAERVFPGNELIVDYRVDAGVPFPESHSAYWSLGGVFDAIHEAWPVED